MKTFFDVLGWITLFAVAYVFIWLYLAIFSVPLK